MPHQAYQHPSDSSPMPSKSPIPPLPHWTFIFALIATIGIFLITDQRSQKSTESLVYPQDRLLPVKNI